MHTHFALSNTYASHRPLPRRVWDRLGVVLSGLCLAHCFLLPLALLVLPGWMPLGAVHAAAHPALAALLVPVTLVAMRRHAHGARGRGAAVGNRLLVLGLVLVWLALPAGTELGETVLTIGGSLALIGGHGLRLACPTPKRDDGDAGGPG